MAAAGRVARPGPGDRRLQEQLRRQGQQLRLPRELPHGPHGAVRPDRHPRHAPLRHPPDLHRAPARSGTEAIGRRASDDVPFQLTQRADFFEEEVGLETTLKRPIVNTRDEPHADAQKYRRLHVIVGDANLSEVATFLKVGTTALVLCHDRGRRSCPATLDAGHPGAGACARCRYDLSLRQPLELADGTTITALEMQWELLDRARSTPRTAASRRSAPRSATRSCGAGRRCSPASRPTRCRWPASSTGWPSTG